MKKGQKCRKGQTEAVRRTLLNGCTISPAEGFTVIGTTHLASIIFQLRRDGYIIENIYHKGINRYGRPCRWVAYKLISAPQEVE